MLLRQSSQRASRKSASVWAGRESETLQRTWIDYLAPIAVVLQIVAALAIPWLAFSAFRQWNRHLRPEFPAWRNVASATAIAATLLSWVSFFGVVCWDVLLRLKTPENMYIHDLYLVRFGMFMSFALKGMPRLRLLLAGALMMLIWTASIID